MFIKVSSIYFSGLLATIVRTVVPFLLAVFIIEYCGPEAYLDYKVLLSFAVVLHVIPKFGLDATLARVLLEMQSEVNLISSIYRAYLFLHFLLVSLIYCLLSFSGALNNVSHPYILLIYVYLLSAATTLGDSFSMVLGRLQLAQVARFYSAISIGALVIVGWFFSMPDGLDGVLFVFLIMLCLELATLLITIYFMGPDFFSMTLGFDALVKALNKNLTYVFFAGLSVFASPLILRAIELIFYSESSDTEGLGFYAFYLSLFQLLVAVNLFSFFRPNAVRHLTEDESLVANLKVYFEFFSALTFIQFVCFGAAGYWLSGLGFFSSLSSIKDNALFYFAACCVGYLTALTTLFSPVFHYFKIMAPVVVVSILATVYLLLQGYFSELVDIEGLVIGAISFSIITLSIFVVSIWKKGGVGVLLYLVLAVTLYGLIYIDSGLFGFVLLGVTILALFRSLWIASVNPFITNIFLK